MSAFVHKLILRGFIFRRFSYFLQKYSIIVNSNKNKFISLVKQADELIYVASIEQLSNISLEPACFAWLIPARV